MPFTFSPESPWLAPLAGYSDLAFRLLCREYGCAGAFTEMVSAKGLVYGSPGTYPLLETCPEDGPLSVQLFGAEPDFIARAMDMLLEQGFSYFDLNAGCPVKKVVKSGSGAALLLDTNLLIKIARTMIKRAEPGKASFKIRLGWHTGDDVFVDLAKRLEDEGAGWVTLHPRSARQMFSGEADWSRLTELKEAVSIPVAASGDLFSAEDADACLRETGVDTVMFARGALYDPSVFARFLALRRGETYPESTGASIAGMVRRHVELTRKYDDSRKSLRKMRSFIPRYIKGMEGIRALRNEFTHCNSWEELDSMINKVAELQPSRERRKEQPTLLTKSKITD